MKSIVLLALILSAPVAGFSVAHAEDQPSERALPTLSASSAAPVLVNNSADNSPESAVPTATMPRMAVALPNDPAEMTRLAQRFEHAEGVGKDFRKANELYCRAARAGHAEAQFRLGWIYANGRGVRKDDGVAALLFVMAAEQGHEYARRLLQYVRAQPNTELPSCLLPDRVEVVWIGVEDDIEIRGRPEIVALIRQLAPQYAIDPQLVMALIAVESSFNPNAVSPKNAQGLMQLIPETAERFGVKRVFNPTENIKGGLAYLRWLMAFFEGEVRLVLAAYNAGERAVERYRGIPPYEETRSYVQRITGMYRKATHPYDAEVVGPSPLMQLLRKSHKS